MNFGHDDSSDLEIDYSQAWKEPQPFVFLKNILSETIQKLNKTSADYPYDSIFNSVIARGLLISANQLEIDVEVRYKWEVLDVTSVATHSMYGQVVAVDININDESRGFAIDGSEMNMDIMALSYDRIFYVGHCPAHPNSHMG